MKYKCDIVSGAGRSWRSGDGYNDGILCPLPQDTVRDFNSSLQHNSLNPWKAFASERMRLCLALGSGRGAPLWWSWHRSGCVAFQPFWPRCVCEKLLLLAHGKTVPACQKTHWAHLLKVPFLILSPGCRQEDFRPQEKEGGQEKTQPPRTL